MRKTLKLADNLADCSQDNESLKDHISKNIAIMNGIDSNLPQ